MNSVTLVVTYPAFKHFSQVIRKKLQLLYADEQMGLIPVEERNAGENLKTITLYGVNTID